MIFGMSSNEFEIDEVKFPLKIIGSVEKPWPKANDVCALTRHVKPIDKQGRRYHPILSL